MSNDNNNLDMVTFQTVGEDTLKNQEKEIKKSNSVSIKSSHKNAQREQKSKNQKLSGFMIGLVFAFLFIAYDMFKN